VALADAPVPHVAAPASRENSESERGAEMSEGLPRELLKFVGDGHQLDYDASACRLGRVTL